MRSTCRSSLLFIFIWVLGLGCPARDDDDDVTAEDDISDDDIGDDDTGDDDTGDDDTWYLSIQNSLEATGGSDGGLVSGIYELTFTDSQQDYLCEARISFEGTTNYGISQGDDFWDHIDQVVVATPTKVTESDCPSDWTDVVFSELEGETFWGWNPIAFVSCEQIAQDKNLASTIAGDEFVIGYQAATFGEWCNEIAEQYQINIGSGPIEGIWMIAVPEGVMDALGEFGYFPPAGESDIESWVIYGLLFADAINMNEPISGLEGCYLSVPLFRWGNFEIPP